MRHRARAGWQSYDAANETLRDEKSRAVAHIHKEETSQVAHLVSPAVQNDLVADIGETKLSAHDGALYKAHGSE